MPTKLADIMAELPQDRQDKIRKMSEELITEKMLLQNIRKAHQLTQDKMIELLGVDKDSIAKLEENTDLLLSTLNNYLKTMGGNLQITAKFPDHPPVIINSLTKIEPE